MAKTKIERLRIIITRIFSVLVALLIMFSERSFEAVNPLISSILFFIGISLVAVASLGRLWCSLYIAGYKTQKLVTEGPYSISRNPLYFFSFIGAVGVGFATETLTIPLIVAFAFIVYYPSVIRREESKLLARHGEQFKAYLKSTPVFFPNISKLKEPEEYKVNPIVFRNHIFSALWFIWLVGILEILEELHDLGFLPVFIKIY